MKKYFNIILTGVLAAVALSCNKETEGPEIPGTPAGQVAITFEAGNMQTRTSLGTDKAVLWSSGDVLSVFDSELANNKFTQSALSEDYTSASYAGTAVESETYYAVYPYRAGNASAEAGVIDTYLSPDQFAVANSFGVGANLALGVSEDNGESKYFTMQQVGAFVKFSFSGCSTITSICLKALGGEKIAGTVTATCTAGTFDAVSKNDGSSLDEVTLYPAPGETCIAPGTYYAVLLPVTLESGLQILFTEKTAGVEKVIATKITSSITLAKNTVSAIPNTIVLPDVSNAAWMEQETVSVLFKDPAHLMNAEGNTAWPFDEDISTYQKDANLTTDFTLSDGGQTIGLKFQQKSISNAASGFGASAGSCTKWGFRLPAISGKRLAKVEYYTAYASAIGDPRVVNTYANEPSVVYGAVNTTAAAYSKLVWNISTLEANTGCWINWRGGDEYKSSVYLTGFRAVYRDAEGPAKAVISVETDSYGAYIDQNVELSGSFVPYDGTASGYTYGFDYKALGGSSASYAPALVSSGESFYDGDNYGLRSGQGGEWTSVDGTLGEGMAFTATLNTLTRGQAYVVRAWARVGDEGDKVYGSEEEIGLLSKVSSGAVWQYGDDEFFTAWKNCSNASSDLHNYNWEGRLTDGSISSYKYGAAGLFYETTAKNIDFRQKNYLKFGTNQRFSFISAESGTASITAVCKSTASSARNIYVSVNGTRVDTFESSVSDYSEVTSHEFSVNDGDKVSITINNNANLQSIAFNCDAQEASFSAAVDASSKADRNTVYNFTVTASADLDWNVTASAGTLSKSAGTGSDTFTLTVPVNYSWNDSGVGYVVTVTTSDERIAEGNRSQEIALTQAKPTKVLFGCSWGTAFVSALKSAGFEASAADWLGVQCAYAKSNTDLPEDNKSINGNFQFKFVAGEAGDGVLYFKAKIGGNKAITVTKNGTNMQYSTTEGGELTSFPYTKSGSSSEDQKAFWVPMTVAVNDEIIIKYSTGSGNHKLYFSTPVSWSLAE